jgi:prepilin-type N-terminal cleavage/methylation domain-containing protein/prepilin-type processing-associated H-X9-DG protein
MDPTFRSSPATRKIMSFTPSDRAAARPPRRGFTLIELLVVIGILAILASLLMPALSRAKAKAYQAKCLNNLRQLSLSLNLYAEDFSGEYPPRRSPPEAWPHKLKPYFADWQIITCPADRFGVAGLFADEQHPKRSFLINGFNDFFVKTLSPGDYRLYKSWRWPHGMKEKDIPKPTDTIIFGEKKSGSPHVHMDIDQGTRGNDFEEIEHLRHGKGSNFAFVDGSVRLLLKNAEFYPENLWSVRDEFRYPEAPPKP